MDEISELIKTGDNNLLQSKIENNPSLADGKTEQGISFLQFAAYCRNTFAVNLLKSHKNKLDIFEAASIGDKDTLSQLLDINPELLNSFSSDGFTILGLTSFFGHITLIKLLLDKGANPNIPANNSFKVTPLHSACAISNSEIVEILINSGADVNAKQQHGVTPLHSAAHNGQTALVKILIDNNADINITMDNGQTPLFMAQEQNYHDTAEFIKEHGGH